MRSCGQRNSPVPHLGTQRPRSHTLPASHRPPPSTSPLQSSSSALHFSALGCTFCTHVSSPLAHCCVPSLHTPSSPVSQGSPPPLHWIPVTRNIKSSKSLSASELASRSSQPK